MPLDQGEHVLRDRVGRELERARHHQVDPRGLAVVVVVIPLPADRLAVLGQQ